MGETPFVIVVGLDYSELAETALMRAFELAAREPAAEVHVISVLSPLDAARPDASESLDLDIEVAVSQLERHVASSFASFSRQHPEQSTPCRLRVVSHVRFDQAASGIVQLASDLQADLIVVGTHGRRGLTRFLLGSVSERVLRLASCAVLVMRPKAIAVQDPVIEPPCPRCQEARQQATGELWCEQHRTKHGRRHTYHQYDRSSDETNFPLVTR